MNNILKDDWINNIMKVILIVWMILRNKVTCRLNTTFRFVVAKKVNESKYKWWMKRVIWTGRW
jgi:hypothetical protein